MQSMHATVTALVDRGLLDRAEVPAPGRSARLSVTAEGAAVLEAAAEAAAEVAVEADDALASLDVESLRTAAMRLFRPDGPPG